MSSVATATASIAELTAASSARVIVVEPVFRWSGRPLEFHSQVSHVRFRVARLSVYFWCPTAHVEPAGAGATNPPPGLSATSFVAVDGQIGLAATPHWKPQLFALLTPQVN